MATLIVIVLFGLVIGYFAIQNTGTLSLNFLNYTIPDVPIYMVVGGALLVGLLLSWIISLVGNIATGFTIRGKENKIKDYKKENAQYLKQIHQLEIENTRLMANTSALEDDKSL